MKLGWAATFRGLAGWIAFLALALFWGIVVMPLTLLLERVWPGARERFVSWTSAGLAVYVRSLPILRIERLGLEKRLDGARILVVNHQSRLDSPILIALEPRVYGPVRGYMLRVPLLGTMIRMLGFFDIDVGERASVDAVNRATTRAQREGRPLLFYPEGTRSPDGELGPFRRGAFRAAFDHDLPIQPVVIEGIESVFPPGIWVPRSPARHPVKICYLDPLLPPFGSGPRRLVVRDLCERVRSAMADELARLRALRRGEPLELDRSGPLEPPAAAEVRGNASASPQRAGKS